MFFSFNCSGLSLTAKSNQYNPQTYMLRNKGVIGEHKEGKELFAPKAIMDFLKGMSALGMGGPAAQLILRQLSFLTHFPDFNVGDYYPSIN